MTCQLRSAVVIIIVPSCRSINHLLILSLEAMSRLMPLGPFFLFAATACCLFICHRVT
ncbi:hypothetical protein BDB00DRAFT_851454 [Zychaea mexicana]|uniref:uncharacterized protein n=1 Tax=Zychaea mexicana TaxID=64656 RepID=UPI0022FE59D1|nr:uncharacterized protein BDB00DRAFT_851454 [Zychaea mexicana]KAI9485096.1 hypothetical protein BDB00DRAFT_851454 [Zychaea mexicana]